MANTNSDGRLVALNELKLKLAEHQKLAKAKNIFDDAWLTGFLNGTKYDVDGAIKCLEQFIYIRTKKYRQFSVKYMNPLTLTALDVGCIRTLKYSDEKGRRIGVGQFTFWDASKYNAYEVLAECVLHMDESMRSYLTGSVGNECIVILDLAGLGIQHIRQGTPSKIVQYFDFFLNNIPVRIAGIHLLNMCTLGKFFLSVCKRCLKEKLRSRIYIHNDLESFHGLIPTSALPLSLGGDLNGEDAYENEFVSRIRGQQTFYKRIADLAMNS
ncbi:alpha-tocopherol transfer protein-like [Folsomia candida]|uniref:Clavesin-2 n=1 Tax=Folsomia candida TaxID=158441 RepID=A0A226ELX9_FOLCA|nr:alpha-tocopherol transfer protein-like [Folsomia candida]OXA58218.1 Clavesin-2 [Folsomia candida]